MPELDDMPEPSPYGVLDGAFLFLLLLTRMQLGLDRSPVDGVRCAAEEIARYRARARRGETLWPASLSPRLELAVMQAEEWLSAAGPLLAADVMALRPNAPAAMGEVERRAFLALAQAFGDAMNAAERLAEGGEH